MAADLYINGIHKEFEVFDGSIECVESGYFRDCYNSSGLFAFLRKNLQDRS